MTADNALPAGQAKASNLATMIGDAVATAMAALSSIFVKLIPSTTGGLSAYHLVAAATDNATVVKASAGQLYGWQIVNIATVPYKLCFHNSASTPTQGTSVFFTVLVPAQGTALLGGGTNAFTDIGIAFSAGIGITTVRMAAASDIADSATTDAAANELSINLFYK